MTTIGIFTAEKNGGYTGTLETLTLKRVLVFEASEKSSPKAPDYRIYTQIGRFEIGAAWKRKSQGGKPFIAVNLDDPTFPAPITARLIAGENGEYRLFWNR